MALVLTVTYAMTPEEQLIRAFVVPERQARLLSLLSKPNRRRKLAAGLAHLHARDLRFAEHIPPQQQNAASIEVMLRERGAREICHVLSEDPDLDACTLPLSRALEAIVGAGMGTFLSCNPGLGYFESEEPGERYILQVLASG